MYDISDLTIEPYYAHVDVNVVHGFSKLREASILVSMLKIVKVMYNLIYD